MQALWQSCLLSRLSRVLIVLFWGISEAVDYDASISPHDDVPQWAADNSMQLELSKPFGKVNPVQYTVIPLTESIGLNESARDREIIRFEGVMRLTDSSNFHQINSKHDVAYLSCDESEDDTFIDPNMMLDELMGASLQAIVLYSTNKNWCSLEHGGDIPFSRIFTMADAAEAEAAFDFFNSTESDEGLSVLLTGNTTSFNTNTESEPSRGSSGAMSALYVITGLISVLFLIIIGVGAYRAHRYPERYGPRLAIPGRPRQSRAKGLARAVLDTIPIVKFGQAQQGKPDPELELDTSTTASREPGAASRTSEDSTAQRVDATGTVSAPRRPSAAGTESSIGSASIVEHDAEDEQQQCSICTENFSVGEDVRVLPCSHQFHPNCVDPWLMNVSGTCPLCRLDLRPKANAQASASVAENRASLPPPLIYDGEYMFQPSWSQNYGRRINVNRLRQATAEEQLQTLRQMRAQSAENETENNTTGDAEGGSAANASGPSDTDVESRHRPTRLASRLMDAFKIRTRSQTEAQGSPAA